MEEKKTEQQTPAEASEETGQLEASEMEEVVGGWSSPFSSSVISDLENEMQSESARDSI